MHDCRKQCLHKALLLQSVCVYANKTMCARVCVCIVVRLKAILPSHIPPTAHLKGRHSLVACFQVTLRTTEDLFNHVLLHSAISITHRQLYRRTDVDCLIYRHVGSTVFFNCTVVTSVVAMLSKPAAPTHNAQYKSFTRHGSAQQNREGREMSQAQKLNTAPAIRQQSVANMPQSDSVGGRKNNVSVTVEKEGGTMINEFAKERVRNRCRNAERMGSPYIMWDNTTQCLKYLHCQLGNGDTRSRRRNH